MDWKEFIVQVQGIYSMGPLNPWKNPVFFTINTSRSMARKNPHLGPLTSGKDVPSLWNQAWERFCREGVGRINAGPPKVPTCLQWYITWVQKVAQGLLYLLFFHWVLGVSWWLVNEL